MQDVSSNASMIEVSAEEGISSGWVFLLFCFFFAVVFIVMAIQEKKSKQET